ncbi:MAG: hypothetical protein M5U19_21835 [Microthrixaceae bacterium]|nr:hypothetical protein [Microthrixaceae bacterium]
MWSCSRHYSHTPRHRTPAGPARLAYIAEYLPIEVLDRSVDPPHVVVTRHGEQVTTPI